MKKLTISDVNKKHLRVIAYLLGSWGLALCLVYVMEDPRLVGLAPVLNFVAVLIQKELSKEGYFAAKK